MAWYDPTGIKGYVGYASGVNDNLYLYNALGGIDYNATFHTFNGGNVGMGGVTSPSTPLDIMANSGSFSLRLRARAADDYNTVEFTDNAGTQLAYIGTLSNESFAINVGAGNRIEVNSVGTIRFNDIVNADFLKTDGSGNISAGTFTFDVATGVDGVGVANRVAYWADANTLTYSDNFQYAGDEATLDGILFGGDETSTTGSVGLAIRYGGSTSYLNSFGSMYSSGGTLVARGVRHGVSGYTSTSPIVTGKEAYVQDNDGHKFLTASSSAVPFGNVVSMAERLRITTGGDVGIGTDTPLADLHIFNSTGGEIRIASNAAPYTNTLNLYYGANQNMTLDYNAGNAMTTFKTHYVPVSGQVYGSYDFQTKGSTGTLASKFWIDGYTGNVGIGTTAPAEKLEVNGNVLLQNSDVLVWKEVGGAKQIAIKGNASDGMSFVTNDFERMTIETGGDVGIGTTAPTSKLHIADNATTLNGEWSSIKAFSNGNSLIYGHTNPNYDNAIGAFSSNGHPFISFFAYHGGTTNTLQRSSASAIPAWLTYTLSNSSLEYYTAPVGTLDADITDQTLRFSIGHDGVVTIPQLGTADYVYTTGSGVLTAGTFAFDAATGVDGVGVANRVAYWSDANTLTNDADFVFDGSDVGIGGTPVGGFVLNIEETGSANIRMYDKATNYWALRATTDFAIDRGGVEHFRITSGGNVGIGTTTPDRQVEIEGLSPIIHLDGSSAGGWLGIQYDNATYDGYFGMLDNDGLFFIDQDSDGADFVITQAGNVGIGTTTPAVALDISKSASGLAAQRLRNSHALGFSGTEYLDNGGTVDFYLGLEQGGGDARYNILNSGDHVFYGNSVERMRIENTGNVGIGTTTPYLPLGTGLNVKGSTYGEITISRGTSSHGSVLNYATEADVLQYSIGTNFSSGGHNLLFAYGTGRTIGMMMEADGAVKVGTTVDLQSSSEEFSVLGMAAIRNNSTTIPPMYLQNQDVTAATIQPYMYLNNGGNRAGLGVQADDNRFHQFGQGGFRWWTGNASFTGNDMELTTASDLRVKNAVINDSDNSGNVNYSMQKYIEAGYNPTNILGGQPSSYVLLSNDSPYGKVELHNGYTGRYSDYIPVREGDKLYGEMWVMRETGATGTAGTMYFGIARFDKDKKPIAGNNGLEYFVAGGATPPSNSTWVKYSGTTTLPTSHTPYSGSDGGAVRYVKILILINYLVGTIPTHVSGIKMRSLNPYGDLGQVEMGTRLTIAETSPDIYLNDTDASADDFWIHANSNTFYVLTDRDDDGSWDGTYPLYLLNTTETGQLYGHNIITDDGLSDNYFATYDAATDKLVNSSISETSTGGVMTVANATSYFNHTSDPAMYINKIGGTSWNYFDFLDDGTRQGYFGWNSGDQLLIHNAKATEMYFYTSAAIRMTIDPDGDVGIGTTTPLRRLDVRSPDNTAPNWISGAFGTDDADDKVVLGNYLDVALIGGHNSALTAWADLSINGGGGDVGIGTYVPLFKLHVEGTAQIDDGLFLERENGTKSGISWYSDSYTAWSTYMSPAGQAGSGPTGNITAPSGSIVTSWALRNFIENGAGYGWTFESGTSGQTTPTVVAEIRASDGAARFAGEVSAGGVADDRTKFQVYSVGTSYGIGMGSAYTFGALNEYAMTFQMNNQAYRGFWWGDDGHTNAQGAMSLTTNGDLVVASTMTVGLGESGTSGGAYTLHVDGSFLVEDDIPILRIKDNNSAGGSSTGNVVFYDSGDVSKASISLANENIYFDATAAGSQVLFRPAGGTVNHMAVSDDQLDIFGDETIDVALIMTNQHHETASGITKIAGMGGYDASSSGYTAAINFGKETTWTSTASTRDGKMSFLVSENGTLPIVMELASDGQLELSKYDGTTFDDDNFTNATHAVTLDDTDGTVYKTRFESGTYTPALTQITGTNTSKTAQEHRYSVTGNIVTVYGRFTYSTADAAGSNQEYTINLPVTPTVSITGNANVNLYGSGSTMGTFTDNTPSAVVVYTTTGNSDKATIYWEHGTNDGYIQYSFSYNLE